ncbi:hypothetical protein D3C76_614350 [compost metagenome]
MALRCFKPISAHSDNSSVDQVCLGAALNPSHLPLIPIPHQPILPSLHRLADPDHCLGVSLIPGLTQAPCDPYQLDRRPLEVRGQALEVAAEFLVEVDWGMG